IGTYTGHLSFTDQSGLTKVVSVTFTVPAPNLEINPSSLYFSTTTAGGNPPSQVVQLTNTGAGDSNWTVSSDAVWLAVSPSSGVTPAYNGSGFATVPTRRASELIGTYTGHLSFTDQSGL